MGRPSKVQPGQVYGYLRVTERAYTVRDDKGKSQTAMWICRCTACGKDKPVRASNLLTGGTNSCGCMQHKPLYRSCKSKGVVVR